MSEFKQAKRTGKYWDDLNRAIDIINRLSLDIKTNEERKFEDRISGALQPNFNKFIDQRNIQQVITRVTVFGHDHRPDMSIDTDGIAIEVKVANSGSSFREALGQAMIYRLAYRFVIVVMVDISKDKNYYKKFVESDDSKESKFLEQLKEDLNVFTIIK